MTRSQRRCNARAVARKSKGTGKRTRGVKQVHELTASQERFCQLIVAGEGQQAAYERAYASTGRTAAEGAARLRKDRRIEARIAELRKPVVEEAQLTLKEHLRELKRLRELALERDQVGVAVTAENYRGKASGLYTERVRAEIGLTLEQLVSGDAAAR